MELKKTAFKYALLNAVQFDGKSSHGAVIGKLISQNPELKTRIKDVAAAAKDAVREVNEMPLSDQTEKLKKVSPELLVKKKAEKRTLAELPNAVKGKVVTRIPPEPSKYAHIGHAISFMINYLYAKKYKGKCYLRFEDTNPELSRKEYADAILEDMEYLGIKPDKITYVSDDIAKFYSYAEKMIESGCAYACFCSVESMRELRQKGSACECRTAPVSENRKTWKKMLARGFDPGEAVVRFKGDMKSKNSVLRDPVIFRINYKNHYRHGKKYGVWPLYDFANSVEDGTQGVTHILRSIEFGGMRVELQNRIKSCLDLPVQTVTQYGRFNVTDALTQGREIRELIKKGEVSGPDDPRLVTIKALIRRGIQPATFEDLAVEVGLSLTPTNLDWTVISSFNRKYLDPSASRYFFIEDPQKITVENAPSQEIALRLHPSAKKSERKFSVNSEFYIAEKDRFEVKNAKGLVRLMDCLNFTVSGKKFRFDSLEVAKYRKQGHRIIQWLPAEGNLHAEILMPQGRTTKGLAESSASKIGVGKIVQFARFGFCRLEKKTKDCLRFVYCHE